MDDGKTFYTRSGILKATLSAFLTWLGDEFKKYGDDTLNVYLTRNISDMRQPGRVRSGSASDEAPVYGQEHKDTTEYPMLRVALGEISIDNNRGGMKRQRMHNGVLIGVDKEQGIAYTDTMIPVRLSLGARIDTSDLDQLLILATQLFHALPRVSFKFISESGSVPIETSVDIEPSLTIPQADLGSPGSPYSLETTFVVNTYIGHITTQRVIRTIEVAYGEQGRVNSTLLPDNLRNSLLEMDTMHHYDLFDKASKFYKYEPPKE